MGFQFDAVWMTTGVKLEVGMHVVVTEEVAYGSERNTLFLPGKAFHIAGFNYNYDYGGIEVELAAAPLDKLSIGRLEQHLEDGQFRLITEPRA